MNKPLRQIMVPLDGSAFAEQALPLAQFLAKQAEATLHLVHVRATNPVAYAEEEPMIDEKINSHTQTHEQGYLTSVANQIQQTADQSVKTIHLEGVPGSVLAEYAVDTEIDLIVMTTHGRGGLARAWLGSVADTLARVSSIPVLLLRPQHQNEGDPSIAQAVSTPKKILIPLDGSVLAEDVLKPALTLATILSAELRLVRVIPTFETSNFVPDLTKPDKDNTAEQRRAETAAYLEHVAEQLRSSGYTVQTRVLHAEQPATAILEEVHAEACDLIALSTHGRSGIKRLIIGSVADKVARAADSPVLLYRPTTHTADHS